MLERKARVSIAPSASVFWVLRSGDAVDNGAVGLSVQQGTKTMVGSRQDIAWSKEVGVAF